MNEKRREKQRQTAKEWRKKNPEKVRQYNKDYYYEVRKVRIADKENK